MWQIWHYHDRPANTSLGFGFPGSLVRNGKWKIVDFPDSPLLHRTTPLSQGLSAFDYILISRCRYELPPHPSILIRGIQLSLNSLDYKCHIPLWPCCRPLMRRQCDKDLILLWLDDLLFFFPLPCRMSIPVCPTLYHLFDIHRRQWRLTLSSSVRLSWSASHVEAIQNFCSACTPTFHPAPLWRPWEIATD